jgi:RNA polymerase sigma factor (sigma-70 family)
MTQGNMGSVERRLDVLWTSGTLTGLSDAQLLCRFIDAQDATAESAFSELVDRHGPMVRGVCRQILRHPHDADDAFQATFLVLVRKARSIRVRESLAPWLYGVAYRTAQRARATASRYRQEGVEHVEALGVPPEDSNHLDLRPLLHEELDRLPDKYRAPIVLCHLEGKTHEQAAQLLHWPIGTVSGRLSRGRELLKSRLERRGLAAPSAIFSASSLNLAQSIPISLVESTLTAATRFAAAQSVSTSVLSLTQGVLRIMFLNKLKTVSLVLLLFGAVTGGVGVWTHRAPVVAGQPSQEGKNSAPKYQKKFIAPAPDAPKPVLRGNLAFSSKNTPNLAPFNDPIPVFGTGSILLVTSPDGKALEARSVDNDNVEWHRLPIPDEQQVTPIAGKDVLALAYQGKSAIGTIAAFSAYTGEWSLFNLEGPHPDSIAPAIGPGSALYQVGNDFYAFSALAGKWDLLPLPAEPKARASISEKHIKVQQGDRLYVFGLKPGKWSKGVTMKLPPAKPDKPNPQPRVN